MIAAAYYNENDPTAAAWLRWLINNGHLPAGEVDSRSIIEVQPDDLIGFTQAHFFAGIGGWPYAARLAGWPDDRPLWTGSCPCQPFSVAGKGAGADDERHLWPDFFRIIRARRPAVVMGEQVAGKAGYGWFDGVAADLASENYASRYVDIPSCAVDAPHIRSRGYWIAVANADLQRCGEAGELRQSALAELGGRYGVDKLVNAPSERRGEGRAEPEFRSGRATVAGADAPERDVADPEGVERGTGLCQDRAQQDGSVVANNAGANDVADSQSQHGGRDEPQRGSQGRAADGRSEAGSRDDNDLGNAVSAGLEGFGGHGDASGRPLKAGSVAAPDVRRNGSFWSDGEWITCHDGKARRAKSSIPMLVDGLPGRVAAWRGFGNAINPVLAAEVIAAFKDAEAGQ